MLAIPAALVAGLVSFFSPCVVPLLPGYLSYATGLAGSDLEASNRGRMLAGSLLFVLGFSFVFVSFGALLGTVGQWLTEYSTQLQLVLGGLMILVGVAFLELVPWPQRDVRFHRVPAVGLGAAPLLGVLFGLGWTPCIGPTLTAITSLATNEGSAARRALLGLAYCPGLGVPFIAAGLAFRHMLGVVGWLRRYQAWVTRVCGVLMIGPWLEPILAVATARWRHRRNRGRIRLDDREDRAPDRPSLRAVVQPQPGTQLRLDHAHRPSRGLRVPQPTHRPGHVPCPRDHRSRTACRRARLRLWYWLSPQVDVTWRICGWVPFR